MVACGANFALALGQDVYGEQVKSPVPRKTQERSSSVKRYISPPKRNSKTPHKISSVESARSSASKIHTKIHDKSYYEEASRTGNHKHTDDLSFVDNPMLKKGNESTERHDQKIKDLENELSDMRSSMQRTSDNYKYQAEMHAKETSRLKKLLDEKDKEINELKYNVDIKRNSDNKIIDKLENRLKETETLKDHERNNRIRLENEVNLIDERYAKDLKSKDQEIRKLISDKENLTISYDDAVKQKEKLAELLRLESRRPSKPNEDMYTEELVKRCDQIERSMVTVSRQCENYQIKISNQDKTIVEFKLKIQQLEKENSQLKLDLQEAESKNKQLFTNMEKGLRDRAREFKERTLNLLNTPMGGRVSDRYNLTSPDTTLPLDNSLDIKELHEPTRSISPIQNRTKTDYTSPRLQMKHAQLTQEHQTPPTFREGGGVLKNSLAEIRLRLDLLQENKNELENKINTRL